MSKHLFLRRVVVKALRLVEGTVKKRMQLLAKSAVFFIRNGPNSFYSSILSARRDFIRLDPGCMEAVSKEDEEAMKLYSYDQQRRYVRRISWQVGDVLALDNWRILHGRGEQVNVSNDRFLLRVIVR